MARYSPERKEAILKKMAPPHNMTVAELASQEGISTATLYNWRKAARVRGAVLPSNSAKPDQWSSEEKFRIVLETAPMSEAELSEYCRKNGLYPEQIEAWKGACLSANAQSEEQSKRERIATHNKPLVLHSDNGSPMKAATFLEKLYDLGITPSNSRPRVSNDNAYSE